MYLGVDLGTSSIKIVLTDTNGKVLNVASKDYPVHYYDQRAEQNPLDWFNGYNECLKQLSKNHNLKSVKAVSFCGQMHGLVLVDVNGDVIRPAILWNDNRSIIENEYLNQEIGKDKLVNLTENISFPGFTAPKLLWVKKNEPINFKKIHKVLLPKDYLVYKITNQYATDTTDASGTLYYDVKNKKWSSEMLNIIGITEELLPTVYEPEDVVGYPIDHTYLSEKTKISIGGSDQSIGAIGTGTVSKNQVNISLGTSGVVLTVDDKLPIEKVDGIHRFSHVGNKYYQMGVALSATASLKWFQETILSDNYEKLNEIIEGRKNNIIFHPYLMGERSPINDVNAKGLFYGFDLSTTKEDLTKAVIEGISFSLKDCLRAMNLKEAKQVRITGGGSKSVGWIQLLSNILNLKLEVIELNEGGAFGAAIVAMVSDKRYASYDEASSLVVKKEEFYPNPDFVEYYEKKYQKYKEVYTKLKE